MSVGAEPLLAKPDKQQPSWRLRLLPGFARLHHGAEPSLAPKAHKRDGEARHSATGNRQPVTGNMTRLVISSLLTPRTSSRRRSPPASGSCGGPSPRRSGFGRAGGDPRQVSACDQFRILAYVAASDAGAKAGPLEHVRAFLDTRREDACLGPACAAPVFGAGGSPRRRRRSGPARWTRVSPAPNKERARPTNVAHTILLVITVPFASLTAANRFGKRLSCTHTPSAVEISALGRCVHTSCAREWPRAWLGYEHEVAKAAH